MKLSEKGLKSFDKQMTEIALSNNFEEWDRFSAIRQVKFEPDDFQGMVCLTVEEAKELAKKLNDVGLQHEVDFGDYDYDALDLADFLNERIEQAEKCNEQ